jgi:POT family proton-dependent oligopeptide transporter
MDEPVGKVEVKIESGVTAPAPGGSLASDDEICNLRHVSEPLPMRVWLAATIGMAARFSYYGTQTLFRQYMLSKSQRHGHCLR